MKKIRGRFAIPAACALLAAAILFAPAIGRRPFRKLKASDIASADVLLMPPDRTVRIPETEDLAGYLNDVVIYNRDDSYTEYAGQAVLFTLTMADGTQTKVMTYSPFLVIDGVGYRTKHQPCEALSRYANLLMEQAE